MIMVMMNDDDDDDDHDDYDHDDDGDDHDDDNETAIQVLRVRPTASNWTRLWGLGFLLFERNQGRHCPHYPCHHHHQVNSQGDDGNPGRNILGTHSWVDLERTYRVTRFVMSMLMVRKMAFDRTTGRSNNL